MPLKNTVLLAAAGSRKTELIVESALAVNNGRVLITTYTNENQRHIIQRIERKAGLMPAHIQVMGWFSFLITQCAKPFQGSITGKPFLINGLNFIGKRSRFTPKSSPRYYLDSNDDLYRDGVSDFAVSLDKKTGGAVIKRLERIYKHIFIDEVQDLAGYDLDVIDLLFSSSIPLTMVGDIRQCTLATNIGPRNKKYRGPGLINWLDARKSICETKTHNVSYRCNQAICDFADAIYPTMTSTKSSGVGQTGHDGVFLIKTEDALKYWQTHSPVLVLRDNKNADTRGLPAMNIGLAKGQTFDRVMIFPTQPMLKYLQDKDPSKLKAPERLYVAVTRARFSVAFVVPDEAPARRLAPKSARPKGLNSGTRRSIS